MDYTLCRSEYVDESDLEAITEELKNMGDEEMGTTLVAKWLAEGEEKGIEKGIEKGEQKGLQESVAGVLAARFGHVSDTVNKGLRTIQDADQLK